MNELIVLLTILFITFIGYASIKGFNLLPKKSILELVGYSYGLGVGCIALQLYIYSRLNIPWNLSTLFAPWVVFSLLAGRRIFIWPSFGLPRFNKIQTVLLAGIILACLYTLFEVLLRPVAAWDAWAIWLLKAKIFFIDGTIHPSVLTYVKSDYPILVSLLGASIYLVLGHINDTAVLLAFYAFYVFLAIAFYTTLRKRFGRVYSLLFTLLLVTTQTIIRQGGRIEAGQADLAVGFFAFLSFTLLLEYMQTKAARVLILLNVFLAFTGLVKFDGIPITIVIGLFELIYMLREKLYKHVLALTFWIIPLLDWQIYKTINHITTYTYFAGHKLTFSFTNSVNTLVKEAKELLNIKSWNLLWIGYFYTFLSSRLRKNTEIAMLHVIIISQLFVYTFLYLFTLGNSPESSFERLLVHIAPLALLTIALCVPLFNYGLNTQAKKFLKAVTGDNTF